MKPTPSLLLALLPAILTQDPALAQAVHRWSFDEAAGTPPSATLNTGTLATAGAPTWSALVNSDGATDWATTGTGALRLQGNHSNTGTLVQTAVTLPGLDSGTVRFEWDVSWTLTEAPGVIRETYLINRNQDGSNRFRWTLSNPSGAGDPLLRLNLDGNGFATLNNVTFNQHGLVLNGFGGSLVLRADITFGDVGGGNGVVAVEASYSYNGGEFAAIDLGAFTPYAVANLNELRLHSKGALSGTQFLDFQSVAVSRPGDPEETGPVLLIGHDQGALGLQWPGHYTGWGLQSAPVPGNPAAWQDHPASPSYSGGMATVTVPAGAWDGAVFFRLAQAPQANPYPLFYNPGTVETSGPNGWSSVSSDGRMVEDSSRVFAGAAAIRATCWKDKPDHYFNPNIDPDPPRWHSEAHKAGIGVNHDTRWFGMAVNFDGERRVASRTFAQWMDDQGWYPAAMFTIAPAHGSPASNTTTQWRFTMKVIPYTGEEIVVTLLQAPVAEMYDVWHRFAVKAKLTTGDDGYIQVYHAWPGGAYQLIDLDNGATYRGRTFRNVSGNGRIRFQAGCYAFWGPAATDTDTVRNWIDEVRIADGAASLADVAP